MATLNYLSTAWQSFYLTSQLAITLFHYYFRFCSLSLSFYFQPLPVVVCYSIQSKDAITQNTPSFPLKWNSCLFNMKSVSWPVFWPSSSFRNLTATDNPPLFLIQIFRQLDAAHWLANMFNFIFPLKKKFKTIHPLNSPFPAIQPHSTLSGCFSLYLLFQPEISVCLERLVFHIL